MSRTRVVHRCRECGATAPRWLGRCPDCGEWGTLEEEAAAAVAPVAPLAGERPLRLVDVDPLGASRRATGLPELDRVLGGGFVAGSVTLLGGEPGMGKSTLLLQSLASMCEHGATALLVTAEESTEQVRLRAARLGAAPPSLYVVAETSLPVVLAHVDELQ